MEEIKINDLIIGKITNVKPYAIFLNFGENINGLLHISEISDDYIRDIEKYGTIGDELKVKVLSIDAINGFLRVSLKKVPIEERYSTHDENSKTIPHIDGKGFQTLAKKLPEWIENTLKKEKENNND